MSITLIIILVTAFVSYKAFNDREIFYKLQHNPYSVVHRKEYTRILTHGFIHGDWMHLIFNMYALYMFGELVEHILSSSYGIGKIYYLVIYLGGMAFATLPSLKKHKDNWNYSAIGASGAVSAVIFSAVLLNPLRGMGFVFTPLIPAFIFGPLYLLLEFYLHKRNNTNVAHDAHIYGAIFGIIATVALDYKILLNFVEQILYWVSTNI